MPIPTSIGETPMAQPNQESIQESSEDSISSILRIQSSPSVASFCQQCFEDDMVSFSKWLEYRGYNNFIDLCGDFHYELNHIHDNKNNNNDNNEKLEDKEEEEEHSTMARGPWSKLEVLQLFLRICLAIQALP